MNRIPKNRKQKTEDRRQKTEDRRQKTEDRRQKTEDRRQKTEDRRQKTEDRRQKTEDRRQKVKDGKQKISCLQSSVSSLLSPVFCLLSSSEVAMLFLLLHVKQERYAIDCTHIFKILPRVSIKQMSNQPPFVAGIINYGGFPIPVIDFTYLISSTPSDQNYDTRIIMLEGKNSLGELTRFGFLAEQVTEEMELPLSDFVDPGLRILKAPYLGGVLTQEEGIIQLILADKLFEFLNQFFFKEESKRI